MEKIITSKFAIGEVTFNCKFHFCPYRGNPPKQYDVIITCDKWNSGYYKAIVLDKYMDEFKASLDTKPIFNVDFTYHYEYLQTCNNFWLLGQRFYFHRGDAQEQIRFLKGRRTSSLMHLLIYLFGLFGIDI